MKKITKALCLVALLLAAAISPVTAQTENTNEANITSKTETNATSLAPPAPPKPEMPSSPHAQIHGNSHGIYMDRSHPATVPDLMHSVVPIVAIVTPFACVVAIAGLIFKARRRRIELLHETLRAMIEKGVPIPPELLAPSKSPFAPPPSPFDVFSSGKKSDLRAGLLMLALGFGLLILLSSMDMKIWPVGFIFMLLGGALLLVHKFEKKNAAKTEVAPK